MSANHKVVLTVKGLVKDQIFCPSRRAAEIWAFGDPKTGSKSAFLNLIPADRVDARVEVFAIEETKIAVFFPGADIMPPLVPVKVDWPCKYETGCISSDCKNKRDAANEPHICEQQ